MFLLKVDLGVCGDIGIKQTTKKNFQKTNFVFIFFYIFSRD